MAICGLFSRIYPKSAEKRLHGNDKAIRPSRIAFLRAAAINFILLQVLFLGLFVYIFGSLFQQDVHTHNMGILWVDYDGGLVGTAVRDAYKSLQGTTFPTLEESTPVQYPSPGEMREVVCQAKYWAALYTSPGASLRLDEALTGGSAASSYNRSDVLTFIWNEARYSPIADSSISANLQKLSSTARTAYLTHKDISGLQALSSADPTAISIFADPWTLSDINIQPTTQGSRLIYNTLVIILLLIQEFFYLGTINGLYVQFKIYASLWPHRIIAYRNMISLAYTFVGSLSTTGAIWAFRVGWDVNSNQFVLTWFILWLFAHANFLWLDVMTIWLPVQYVPMSMICWVMFNVTSILVPFELSPGFYRWAYVMPAHEVYQVLTDIWSGGCNPQLRYALPILFSLELIGLVLSGLGVYRRCHYALLAEENQEIAFHRRLDAAMDFERRRDAERQEAAEAVVAGPVEPSEKDKRDDMRGREENLGEVELGDQIRREEDEILSDQRRASRACNFGPSFDLAFERGS
ncbi:Uncharacterized protein BP5553_06659 [Venustampulla echinocandica]|uniref:DUF3533 domain-containing protein n=1 Tax=Venustampulla echinocandica TaxID=2656787 RepID=A0A370TKL4_9HELO|nr:Uncharacterized protein BP5553_06659 [Venustampulla echinocandica]RDL36047.1 Uncharacterized protein BP5553_06659 [Venustampulla echinocandica]